MQKLLYSRGGKRRKSHNKVGVSTYLDDDETGRVCVDSYVKGYEIDTPKIEGIADCILCALGVSEYELSLKFADASEITELNSQYRKKNDSTDVLSFPQVEFDSPLLSNVQENKSESRDEDAPLQSLGDIVISLPNAARNADEIGHGLDREIAFLIVHGILHLCGHDHLNSEEEKIMLEEQKKLMEILSRRSEPPLWLECVKREET